MAPVDQGDKDEVGAAVDFQDDQDQDVQLETPPAKAPTLKRKVCPTLDCLLSSLLCFAKCHHHHHRVTIDFPFTSQIIIIIGSPVIPTMFIGYISFACHNHHRLST